MRFCMVTTFYPPHNFGGDGVFVQQLSRALVAAGHDVDVVHSVDAFRVKGGPVEAVVDAEAVIDGIHVHRIGREAGMLSALITQQTGRRLVDASRLRAVLERSYDVINFHNISLIGGPAVLQLGRAAKLYTLHEHWWVCPTHVLWKYTGELCREPECFRCCLSQRTPPQLWRQARPWMARCLSEVDLVLAPSRFTAHRHQQWMDDNQVAVPLEVLTQCAPRMEAPPEAPADLPAKYFLYVGRLAASKGILDLARVFADRPQYQLVVVGSGECEAELRANGPANVRLVGHVPRAELGRYYRHAVALLFPSRGAETFGLSAIEALACSTPVVSTRCGGTEDIVSPEVGYLYNTSEELAGHLDRLWNDRQERDRLGDNGRRRFEALYTPEIYLDAYLAAVDRARAGHQRRANP